MFISVEVRPSNIFGNGLFPLKTVNRGTVICSFTTQSEVITESEYLAAIQENRYLVVRTGTRYIGKYFTYTQEPDTELNFFNHAFEPNLLVHCGIVIAMREIPAGEELTIDYRYLIDDTEIGIYNDAKTGQPIRGFSPRQTLLDTSRRVISLLESLDDSWQG
jgi:SET domain-containing protein